MLRCRLVGVTVEAELASTSTAVSGRHHGGFVSLCFRAFVVVEPKNWRGRICHPWARRRAQASLLPSPRQRCETCWWSGDWVTKSGEKAIMEIAGRGPGIAPEKKEHILEPPQRGPWTRDRAGCRQGPRRPARACRSMAEVCLYTRRCRPQIIDR